MATTAELERLTALLARLTAIGDKARGELIRSAEWNELVGTVGELTRTVLGEDHVDVVADHEHSEQVGLGWLDPKLRQLLTEGPLADSAALARLGKLERSLTALAGQLKALGADQDGLRGRVSDVATKDLARESTLTTFGRKLDGIGDARDDVAEVRQSLQTVQVDVLRAIEVGQRLEINGEPIDVPGLVGRIDGLDELRERLRLPDGQLLDATEFSRQVAELETRLVTEEELEEALDTIRLLDLPQSTLDQLAAQAASAAEVQLAARLTNLDTDLRTEITRQFSTVDAVVAAAIGSATPGITERVLADARELVDASAAELSDGLKAELVGEFSREIEELSRFVDQQFSELDEGLRDRVTDVVLEVLPEQIEGINGRLDELEVRAEKVELLADSANSRSLATATRVEQVNRENVQARAELRAEIGNELDEIRNKVGPRIDEAVLTARTAMTANIKNQLGALRQSIESDLMVKVADAARKEVRLIRGQLDANVRDLVQDELVATRSELAEEMTRRSGLAETRIEGLVATEVRRATQSMGRLVRTEVESQLLGARPVGPPGNG